MRSRPRSLRPPLSLPAALAAAALSLQVACGGDDGGGGGSDAGSSTPDAGPDPLCLEAADHSDLEWIQANVFTRSCASFTSCHQGSALSAGGLNLEEGMVPGTIVDVPSDLAADRGTPMDIVEPGDPQASYLMHILGRYGKTPEENPLIDPAIGIMPFNNAELCDEKIAAIERWIESL
ncbi:MAG TPA: hypothetical protein VKZ63_18280 [Kofleriaceae bacterium]|nr:hypothetical protein [Kofleriaceae bacterium]